MKEDKTSKPITKLPLLGPKEQKHAFTAMQKCAKSFAKPTKSKLNTNIRNKGGR